MLKSVHVNAPPVSRTDDALRLRGDQRRRKKMNYSVRREMERLPLDRECSCVT
jgi:hypothetical protein